MGIATMHWDTMSGGVTTAAMKKMIIYMSYNNLEEFPASSALSKMVNLGLLDLAYNNIKKLHPFGSEEIGRAHV